MENKNRKNERSLLASHAHTNNNWGEVFLNKKEN